MLPFAQTLRAHPGYFAAAALQAALDLHLPEALHEPRLLADLAAQHGWDLRRLQVFALVLADLRWGEQLPDQRWRWRYTGPPPPPQFRDQWGRLAEVIATGQPLDSSEHTAAYQQSMAEAHAPAAAEWAQRWLPRLPAEGTVLDVGAGLGTWSLAVLQAREEWRAIQVDSQPLDGLAPPHPRVQRLTADASALPRLPPVDFAVAAHLLHHLGDDAAGRCVGQMVQALRPGGWVSVVEVFELPGQPSPNIARWFDLDMALYSPAGRVRPLAEVEGMLTAAGCAEVGWRLIDEGVGVAEVFGQVPG